MHTLLTWKNQCCFVNEESRNGPAIKKESVVEFLVDYIENEKIDVEKLPLVGFEFFRDAFIEINAAKGAIKKC